VRDIENGRSVNAITLDTGSITVTESVPSLGVTIDSTLSFDTNVNEVCKAVRHHARALRHVRKCISSDAYCNSVLYKTSQSNFEFIETSQCVQNSLAQVVTN